MVEWIKHQKGHYYCIVNCKDCNKKVKTCLYSENIVCKKCFKKAVKEVENKKRCSKCGKEVVLGFYIERKRLFSSKTKKWCFSCYNKLKSGAGKLELKEVKITHHPDYNIPIKLLDALDNLPAGRVPIPKEDYSPEFTKIDDIIEKWDD